MGEVFRATDTRLKRPVAIKILPQSVASEADRLARFQREAEVLASLNHPNIAAIYGIEESMGATALVLELVEGEDLSQRIARGPLPVAEALSVARQIAEALEVAHEHGVIHRDLKPANIKVRTDGTVKVLDFGLAKAVDPAGTSSTNAANSPTLSMHATRAGIILGTAAYMSPEQAAGKPVDKRSDVWALGVVLLEMLTGSPVFTGETTSHILAAVLTREPDWTTLPRGTPASVRKLLRRCLEKDRKRRLDSAADARLELDEALTSPTEVDESGIPGTDASPARSRALPWSVAATFGIALVAALALWAPWRAATARPPVRLLANIGALATLPSDLGAAAILSPDGSTLAFVGQQANQSRLLMRKLDQLQASALAGTEGAANPFFSPDGQWIAFFAGGKLKKVAVAGGAVVTLCDAASGRGGTWTDDDAIVFTADTRDNALMRVEAAGGTPTTVGAVARSVAMWHRWPQALPKGAGLLFTELPANATADSANVVVVPMSGGTPKVVARNSYYGRYVPTGHLLYIQRGTLFAVRFDLDRLETIGQGVPVVEGVLSNTNSAGAQVALSDIGTLVYVPGVAATRATAIDWLARDGTTSVLRPTKADWSNPRFSPDGQKLALDIFDGRQRNIWVYEWARDTMTQLTFERSQDTGAQWSPDGKRIMFSSDRAQPGVSNLFVVNADGTGDVTRLTTSDKSQLAPSWHPNGKLVAFMEGREAGRLDLMILPLEANAAQGLSPGTPTTFLSGPAINILPEFSPDGRWIAYASTEAGGPGFNIYVRPFPGPGGRWLVSPGGGGYPRWSATSRELLFVRGTVMSVPYDVVGDSFRAEKPQVFSATVIRGVGLASPYDINPDGKRLAVVGARDEGTAPQDTVVFVFNFFDYLRKAVPAK